MNSKATPVLVILLVVAAFLIGMFWTKIQVLEGGKTGTNNAVVGNNAGTGNQPTATQPPAPAPLSAEQMKNIASVGVTKGNASAKVTIVEFSDFQCPYCSKVQPTIKQIEDTYKDKVKFVFRNYPLPFHDNAQKAAEASLCANEQGKFWELHDKMFANQDKLAVANLKQYAVDLGLDTEKFNTCLDTSKYKDTVANDTAEGGKVGVSGTPAFFINGTLLAGAYPFEEFKKVIDAALK